MATETSHFDRKIKTAEEVRRIIGSAAIIADGYRLLKIDTLDNRSISDDILRRISGAVGDSECDAVVFGDFRHGIFNRRTVPAL